MMRAVPGRVRASIASDRRDLVVFEAVTGRFADLRGLAPQEAERLRRVVGELAGWLLERAYGDDATGELALQLELTEGAVRVQLEDWGAPITSFGGGLRPVPAELEAVDALTTDLRLVNLGREGKRLSAALPAAGASAAVLPVFGELMREAPPAPAVTEALEVRDTEPGDIEAISRLLYENYGLSYGHPDFYRPVWLAAEIEAGRVRSTVAVVGGEVIGHHALLVGDGEAAAETGIAVVHPAYRGIGVFDRLFGHTLERARAAGLGAVFGSAVTTHPYSQRAELARGYRECALLLGAVPGAVASRGIDAEGEPGARTASLVSFLPLASAARAVTLPERHRDVLRAAYARLGLETTPADLPAARARVAGEPAVRSGDDVLRASGRVSVGRWDADTPKQLVGALRRLIEEHDDVAACHLDLHALDERELGAALELLDAHDFFLAGLLPYGRHGHDRLCLQRLMTDHVELEQVALASEHGEALHAAVLDDRARVLGA